MNPKNNEQTQAKQQKQVHFTRAWDAILHNDGYMTSENGDVYQVQLSDMLKEEDLQPLTTQAITHVMQDEIEPMSVVYDNFFTELKMTTTEQSIIVHNIGPLTVEPLGRYGTEYPETNLAIDQDGQEINLRLQRYGIELRMHEDAVSRNQIPLVSLWMRRARNAFARNREKLGLVELLKTGIVTFDNNSPGDYSHDVESLTGRDISGAFNGTMTLNDLMKMYTKALLDGFTLDTILMHPFAWQTFMTDPEMKEIVVNNNTITSYRPPNGSGATGRFSAMEFKRNLGLPWSKGAGNDDLDPTLAKLGQNPYSLNNSVLGASYNIKPKYWPTPLNIVVSPHVPLRTVNGSTVSDIIFAQSNEAGLVLREGEPLVRSFNVEEKEAIVTRMREGLAFGTMNLGKGVRVAKNVVVGRNYVFQNTNSVSLGSIDTSADRMP